MLIAGRCIVYGRPRQIAGVAATESVASVRLATTEASPVALLWAHDARRTLASTAEGSLQVGTDDVGVWFVAEVEDETKIPAELRAGVASGKLGASVGWNHLHGARYRWHMDGQIPRREVIGAVLHEASITASPAYTDTIGQIFTGELAAKWLRLHRKARPSVSSRALEPADLVLTQPRGGLADVIEDLLWRRLRGVERMAERELAAVKRAREENPTVRIIDVVYPRTVWSAAMTNWRRRIATASSPGDTHGRKAPAVTNPHVRPGPPNRGGNSGRWGAPRNTTGGSVMNDDTELETRPSWGAKVPASVRDNMRRIREFDDALEARIPGARRWIKCYKPYTDASGVWHAGPVLRDKRAPLTVHEALEHLNAQARRHA